jgi:hypothetical protein
VPVAAAAQHDGGLGDGDQDERGHRDDQPEVRQVD